MEPPVNMYGRFSKYVFFVFFFILLCVFQEAKVESWWYAVKPTLLVCLKSVVLSIFEKIFLHSCVSFFTGEK